MLREMPVSPGRSRAPAARPAWAEAQIRSRRSPPPTAPLPGRREPLVRVGEPGRGAPRGDGAAAVDSSSDHAHAGVHDAFVRHVFDVPLVVQAHACAHAHVHAQANSSSLVSFLHVKTPLSPKEIFFFLKFSTKSSIVTNIGLWLDVNEKFILTFFTCHHAHTPFTRVGMQKRSEKSRLSPLHTK